MTNIFGVSKIVIDNNPEQKLLGYKVGETGSLPLALFLAYTSRFEDSVARYFHLCGANTASAKQKAHSFYQNTGYLEELIKKINDSEIDKNYINNDTSVLEKLIIERQITHPLNILIYAQEFAKILVGLTPMYNTGFEFSAVQGEKNYIYFVTHPDIGSVRTVLESAAHEVLSQSTMFLNLKGIKIVSNQLDTQFFVPIEAPFGG